MIGREGISKHAENPGTGDVFDVARLEVETGEERRLQNVSGLGGASGVPMRARQRATEVRSVSLPRENQPPRCSSDSSSGIASSPPTPARVM